MESGVRRSILFLCTHNSARSQMAEGLLRADHGDRFEPFSAGTEATRVKPMAVDVMAEIGIDISRQTSKVLNEFLDRPIDLVVTVCDAAREACPIFPKAVRQIHHAFEDPSDVDHPVEARREAFRRVRDEIREWLASEFG